LSIYGYLLGKDFAVDDLLLVCAIVPPTDARDKVTEGLATAICQFVRSRLVAGTSDNGVLVRPLAEGPVTRLHVFCYDADGPARDLQKCIQYWLGKRPPSPAANPNRCRRCQY